MAFSEFDGKCLEAHNKYRDLHGVPRLLLSKKLCAFSQSWANTLAAKDQMQHSTNSGYGENIYSAWSSNANHVVEGNTPVDSWYSEINKFRFGTETVNYQVTGHFTQVVWKASQELGVGIARGKRGNVYVVCNYSPPGNYQGRYVANVPVPKQRI